MKLEKIKTILKAHGVIFEEIKTKNNVSALKCFVYANLNDFDILDETKIISGNRIEKMTLKNLAFWLGY